MGKEVAFLPERKTKEAGKKLTAPSPRWQPHSGTRSLDKTEVVFKISPYGLFSSGGEGAVKPGIGWVFFFFFAVGTRKAGVRAPRAPAEEPRPLFFCTAGPWPGLCPGPPQLLKAESPCLSFPMPQGCWVPGAGGCIPRRCGHASSDCSYTGGGGDGTRDDTQPRGLR